MTHGTLLEAAVDELALRVRTAWPSARVTFGAVEPLAGEDSAYVQLGATRREPLTVTRFATIAEFRVGLLLPDATGIRLDRLVVQADALIAAVEARPALGLGRDPRVTGIEYGADDSGRPWLLATIAVNLEEGQP